MAQRDAPQRPLRLAVVYDGLFPATYGGAERWLCRLAEELAALGHDVTYLTRDFGLPADPGGPGPLAGVRVVPLTAAAPLYDDAGVRRLGPALVFARAVRAHLRRSRGAYDAVYVAQAPLLPVLGAWAALRGSGTWWAVEWLEWWPRAYWARYAPGPAGAVGWAVQRAALAATPRAFVHSRRAAAAVARARPGLPVAVLPGMVLDAVPASGAAAVPPGPPLVLTVGRLVPEKRPAAAVEAVAEVVRRRPGTRGAVVGEGPLLGALRARVAALGMAGRIDVTGPVPPAELERLYRSASVLLHPSAREGFCLVVVEAARHGVPAVVVDGPHNAAEELVRPGVTGEVCAGAEPAVLADAVLRVLDAGAPMRAAAADWFAAAARTRGVRASAEALAAAVADSGRA